MAYYYFIKNKRIVMVEHEVNLALNPAFTQLTEEQSAFYEKHPKASVFEVKQCSMNEPQKTTLKDLKAETLARLSQLSLNVIDRVVKPYQVANAQASLAVDNGIYNADKAKQILEDYNKAGADLRNIYYEAETAIKSAKNAKAVESLLDKYTIEYENYEKTAR